MRTGPLRGPGPRGCEGPSDAHRYVSRSKWQEVNFTWTAAMKDTGKNSVDKISEILKKKYNDETRKQENMKEKLMSSKHMDEKAEIGNRS